MKKQYDMFDLFKLLASILVLTMHMVAFSDFSESLQFYGVQLLARWGVPFFFIASSFFLFKKGEQGEVSRDDIVGYTKRILMLYLVWFIFNIPQIVYQHLILRGITNAVTWGRFAVNLLTSSTFTGSWYLVSSIFSAWFVYLLCKKLSTVTTLLISFVLYLICILTSAYSGLLPDSVSAFFSGIMITPCNSIICGCFFFALGKFLVENKQLYEKLTVNKAAVGAVAFGLLYYVEIFLLKHFGVLGSTDASFAVIPWALFIVILCIKSERKFKYAKQMRKMSTVIYCSQGVIILASGFLCARLLPIRHSIFDYILGLAMVGCTYIAVAFLQKHCKAGWTKYLT